MADNASAGSDTDGEVLTRRELEQHIKESLDAIRYKTENQGRISDSGNEKVRMQYHRARFYGVNVAKSLLEMRELEDLTERVERIEEERERVRA